MKGSDMLTISFCSKAYHVSNEKYSIATADHGAGATIKIWTLGRVPSSPQGQVSCGFSGRCSKELINALVVPCVSYVKSMDSRCPTCCTGRCNAEGDGENPQCWRGTSRYQS